jgi:zinc transporter ZupT
LDPRLLAIGAATGLATLCGGMLALSIRARLDMLSAFGGGAMIGVAFADLLPEALALHPKHYPPLTLTILLLVGFMAYMILARVRAGVKDSGPSRALGPASLVAHSVMDGLGIGLAFSVSASAGLLVATAVLTHDLVDGANTVTLSFSGDERQSRAWLWLFADAFAPLGGIELSRLIAPSPDILAPLLALFAGFFVYIATAELLPRAGAGGHLFSSGVATLFGASAVVAIVLIGAP